MPSLHAPPHLGYPLKANSSIPAAPSSLVGLSVSGSDTTARVRTGQGSGSTLGKLARPTLSWAAALVALGIFVGVGSAVVSRNDSLRAPSEKSAEKSAEKADKDEKTDKLAAGGRGAAPSSSSAPIASAKFATPPPPLTPLPIAAPVETAGVVFSAPPASAGASAADPMADIAALAAGMTPPNPTKPPALAASPAAGRTRVGSRAVLGPEARDALELAKSKAADKADKTEKMDKAEKTEKAETASAAPAPTAAPAAPSSKGGAKQKEKEIDLSKQAADLAAEQMKSLL